MFGRYFYQVCKRLHVSGDQIAVEAGIDPSTKSKITREGKNKPQLETIEKIVQAMMRHQGWLHKYKTSLFNLAHHSTDEQYEEAVHDLIYMEFVDEKYGPDYVENNLEQQGHEPLQE